VTIVLLVLLGTYLLWPLYIAAMSLKRVRDEGKLGPVARNMAIPIIVFGYLLDVAVNITAFSILFVEPPRDWTVTARLKRHVGKDHWRGRLARWFALHLLDAFDPSGKHI